MDPAVFRWYSAGLLLWLLKVYYSISLDMTQVEFFRYTPRTIFLYVGASLLFFYAYTRILVTLTVRFNFSVCGYFDF
jgi:hypothetical protein